MVTQQRAEAQLWSGLGPVPSKVATSDSAGLGGLGGLRWAAAGGVFCEVIHHSAAAVRPQCTAAPRAHCRNTKSAQRVFSQKNEAVESSESFYFNFTGFGTM